MNNATMEKAINIQGLEYLATISPWETYEDPDSLKKEKTLDIVYLFGDVSIYAGC